MEGVAKKKASKVRNPLEPLLTFNVLVLRLLGLGLALAVLGFATGHGIILGWGRESICVTTTGMSANADRPWDLHPHPGAGFEVAALSLCTGKPSAGQRWWYSLEELPGTATVIVVALTTFLALRLAQRQGVYTTGIATRLRFLGWFLIADSVLRPTIEVYASHKLWASMADGPMPLQWSPVWPFLFAGIALLSLARIMQVGSAMREDLEGVV